METVPHNNHSRVSEANGQTRIRKFYDPILPVGPAIARDVLDHALALGADFAELFVERKRRSQLSLLSSQIENISGGLDFGIGLRLCYGHKVLYGYTNLASRDELLRIVSLLAAKDRRDPVVIATAFDFSRLSDRNPVALPLSADKLLEQKIAYLHTMDAAARAESTKVSQLPATCWAGSRRWRSSTAKGCR